MPVAKIRILLSLFHFSASLFRAVRPTSLPVQTGNKMAARRLSIAKELYDMECCICIEVFTDPRVLPCQHTFCLKCLMNYGKDKPPGDDMRCPLCRKEFTIPAAGLSGIQKNFDMEKLATARKLSAGEEAGHTPCDVCSSDNIPETVLDNNRSLTGSDTCTRPIL